MNIYFLEAGIALLLEQSPFLFEIKAHGRARQQRLESSAPAMQQYEKGL